MADLQIQIVRAGVSGIRSPLLVVQVFERDEKPEGMAGEIDALFGGAITRIIARGDFTGRKDEVAIVYPPDDSGPIERLMLVGVGKREDFVLERLRRAVGAAVRQAERMRIPELGFVLGHTEHLSEHLGAYYTAFGTVEAAVLAAWDFREMKTTQKEGERPPASVTGITLFAADEEQEAEFRRAAHHGSITGRAGNLARDLATRPGNVATPTFLAGVAQEIADEHSLKITVLDRAAIAAEGMKALIAVAQGSEEEPRFIALEYEGGSDGRGPLVLVGKGVTFDSGGISIKPSDRMEEMKYDMSGAAAVLAAMRAIAELKLPVHVVGLVPSTENLPSGSAVKPGDVIGSHLGKTIEVVNTDAEGRLILADALSYARRYKPSAIIDAATLTGAVVVALGNHAIGLMGNDGDLMDEVRAVGQRVGERCWALPLWDEYRQQIDSPIADIKNTGGRAAGSITAGWFLKEFVGTTPWVHLDIAGTAWRDDVPPYLRKGATGVPARLFIEWVRSRSEG
jgi:leucyl aminopeptidase